MTRSWVVHLLADGKGEFTPSGMDGAEDMGDTYESAPPDRPCVGRSMQLEKLIINL